MSFDKLYHVKKLILDFQLLIFRTGDRDCLCAACPSLLIFHGLNYITKTQKKPAFIPSNDVQPRHCPVCLWLLHAQPLHQPPVLLRRELPRFLTVPRPLEASVLQPLIQQHKAVSFPVQPFDRSFRRPQNRNSAFWNGSSWNRVCTIPARPPIPRRRSVYPQARYIGQLHLKSLSMTLGPE